MNALDLINAALAMPHTHAVVTKYADGTAKRHEVRSVGAANNWAAGERRKIGRELIAIDGRKVRVVSVDVVAL